MNILCARHDLREKSGRLLPLSLFRYVPVVTPSERKDGQQVPVLVEVVRSHIHAALYAGASC